MITIRLPYDAPPLRSNDRMVWQVRAQWVRLVRSDARNIAGWMRISRIDCPVAVTLVWTVTDRRRRDVGASAPTLKAAIDGLVDADVLPGDHHEVVVAETCRIEVGDKPGVRIEIEEADLP